MMLCSALLFSLVFIGASGAPEPDPNVNIIVVQNINGDSTSGGEDQEWCQHDIFDISKCDGDLGRFCHSLCKSAMISNTTISECSSPWLTIGGRCYLFNTHIEDVTVGGRSWKAGRAFCKLLDADLATAGHGGASDVDPLLKYIYDNDMADSNRLYLGGERTSPGSPTFHWLDGRYLSVYSFLWGWDVPSGGDCIATYAGWTNNDVHRNYIGDTACHYTYNFVCEK